MKLPRFAKVYHIKNYNFTLAALVLSLSVLGIFVVGSAREIYQSRQILGVAIGLCVMFVISLFDYVWVLEFYWMIYLAAVASLASVLVIGQSVNGAKRWINLGFTTFQPSELAKILLILFFSKFIMNHIEDLNDRVTLIKYAVLSAVPLGLIFAEPNLSTTILTALVLCLIIYAGGLSYRIIGKIFLVLIPTVIIFLTIAVMPNQPFLQEYQQRRILAFINREEEQASDEVYQQNNSVMAIGSGKLTGKGLNNNTTTSVKNGNFIPEPQTDFIFAIVGEELGFIGGCIVIALLLLIVVQCILIGIRAQDLAGRILCCGVGGLIGVQSFVNISVATGLIPNTGVPLPFVSYGLTSLVSLYMGIGFVLNVGLQPKKYQ
ncbi:rod shape-determining protein RodA [Lachnospiraceae bacterium MD308]|nr:rod shape-determining protein RodA [Lachnospiraceae bacterium MD308]MCI8579968.1 rod shape-determining protein RodA [Dorea sp.]